MVTLEANIERFDLSAEKDQDLFDNSRPVSGCGRVDEIRQHIIRYILRMTKCKFLQGQLQSKVSNSALLWDVTTLEEHCFSMHHQMQNRKVV